MLHIVSLFLFLGFAVWEDYRTQKISNLLIFIAFINAFLYQFGQSGVSGILVSVFHVGVMILVLFPLYLCKAFGAGDIKLLGVSAVYLSWQIVMKAFLAGLYFSLIPIFISIVCRNINFTEDFSAKKISMSGPIMGGILFVLYKEGCF